ncbi:MAG: peptide-methionine (S)-S-oxide reductase MsrA [Gemmatimonadales bacterium]|jgi:peptide-methionine (S)-S-oxide reductase
MAIATFAAGCFWGVEAAFRKVTGVRSTAVGYTGGTVKEVTYQQVCSGATGHAEAVRVQYDPEEVSYEGLLEVFWNIHDPTTQDRQGPDVGSQYRSAVFYHDSRQKDAAESSKQKLERSGRYWNPIVTEITPASEFYTAEEHHQQYYEKRGLE